MNTRLKLLARYLLDRMSEASTWQGLGFVLGLCGAKWGADLDWGSAAALGGTISAGIKATFPDTFGEGERS